MWCWRRTFRWFMLLGSRPQLVARPAFACPEPVREREGTWVSEGDPGGKAAASLRLLMPHVSTCGVAKTSLEGNTTPPAGAGGSGKMSRAPFGFSQDRLQCAGCEIPWPAEKLFRRMPHVPTCGVALIAGSPGGLRANVRYCRYALAGWGGARRSTSALWTRCGSPAPDSPSAGLRTGFAKMRGCGQGRGGRSE